MKLLLILAYLSAAVASYGQYVPTPHMAVSVAFGDDEIPWKLQFMDGNAAKIIAEFTPPGQSIQNWKEMVAQEITFTRGSLAGHLKTWRSMVTKADPKILMEETKAKDGSITVIYRSTAFNEVSIRRFIKARDGVYALAYHMRLNQEKPERMDTWKAIIAKATLIPNPQRK